MHLAATGLAVAVLAGGGHSDFATEFDRSGGTRTSSYAQTIAELAELDHASKWIKVETFGTSGEGRALPLVMVDRRGHFTPEAARRDGNAVVLIQAGIHAGEIDGKDAGLRLLKDIAIDGSLAHLLDHVTLLFIPIYNVDGHENTSPFNRPNQAGPENPGFRANATNLNLNRDYMKLDAPETRAWIALFNQWRPDLFIDCHVTDGADYRYVMTYIVETWQYTDPAVAAWSRDRLLKPLEDRMRKSGYPLSPYCEFRVANDPTSGIKSHASTPRFSTGYATLRNRPALLLETHMLKDYATRVDATHSMLVHALGIANADARGLRAVVAQADALAASPAFRGTPFPLVLDVSYADSVLIDFAGVAFEKIESDITGGVWYRYGATPATFRIPYFPTQRVVRDAALPEAYLIPRQWADVIARLECHGVRLCRLGAAVTIPVESIRLRDPAWSAAPFEGRHAVTYTSERFEETRTFPAGSVVVDMAQANARVIAHLLEPDAPDAFVQWGFFDASFEEKEYIESYVMEAKIREMLASDLTLATEFAEAKLDTAFAGDPERIRRWFYVRSPYFEHRAEVYPVGLIRDRAVVDALCPAR
jgi:murein tripeptide amidase MpaA